MAGRPRSICDRRNPVALTVGLCVAWFICGVIVGRTGRRPQAGPPLAPPGAHGHAATAAAPARAQPGSICDNSCITARDGTCDDGTATRTFPGQAAQVLCDLGTDCDDCGAWQGPAAVGDWNGSRGPVEMLRRAGIQVQVKRAGNRAVAFMMPFTDPKKDVDVSGQMHHTGVVEGGISWVFYTVLKDRCKRNADKPALVLDVGANFGWFTLLSASLGCRVVAWEPVPSFRAFLEYGLQLNNLSHLVTVHSTVVAAEAGQDTAVVVPNRGIWGTAGIAGLNIDDAIENEGPLQEVRVKSETLDGAVEEDAALLKVDVEGFEPYVLHGARRLLRTYRVDNVLLEYSPGVAQRRLMWEEAHRYPRMLLQLLGGGYQVVQIEDSFYRTLVAWEGPLPRMPVITEEILQYDMLDAVRMRKGALGCPKPEELHGDPTFRNCMALPEDLHPNSFQSTFGHNTNVWATLNKDVQQLGRPACLLPLETSRDTWFVPEGQKFGMGMRPCDAISPKYQVRHRCRCSDPKACGKQEELVAHLAAMGKLRMATAPRSGARSVLRSRPALG